METNEIIERVRVMTKEATQEGIILGLEEAKKSLTEFLRIKEEKHKMQPTMSVTELNLFMETTINLYKEDFKKEN